MAGNDRIQMLDGYTVLDFSQYVTGPTTSRMMAELGAEVIKVELAPGGDVTRGFAVQRGGRSGYFVQHNRGKKSLCVDIRKPEAVALLRELVKKADVLIENFTPGAIGRMGFGYDAVKALNPKIIMCSVSGYGQEGPLATAPGFDPTVAAYAGIVDMIGPSDGPPVMMGLAVGDTSTGAHAFGAVVTALLYRERTGVGQYLDIALLDCWFSYLEVAVQRLSLAGEKTGRGGSRIKQYVPSGIFKSRDGYLMIAAYMDTHWRRLCAAMNRTEMTDDPRFATLPARNANAAEVYAAIEGWLETLDDEAAVARLRETNVPSAPVLTVGQAMQHPHLRQRGTVRRISDRILGEFDVPGPALRFSEFPEPLDQQAPLLGEHNAEVLTRHLGYDAAQVEALWTGGVIGGERESAPSA